MSICLLTLDITSERVQIVNKISDGPLLQRASTVDTAHWDGQSVPLNVSMAQELPRFFGGTIAAPRQAVGNLYHWSYAFNNTFPTGNGGTASNNLYPVPPDNEVVAHLANLVMTDAPLHGVIEGCPGTCTAKLRAPALAVKACTSTKIPVDYGNLQYIKNAQLGNTEAVPLDWEMFFISIGLVLDEKESLNLVTAYPEYSDFEKCTGHLNMTACTLESAIGDYDVQIIDGKATLIDAANPNIIAWANNTAVDPSTDASGGRNSTLGTIVEFAYEHYDMIAARYATGQAQSELITNGPGLPIVREFEKPTAAGHPCTGFVDPRPSVLKDINKMMVWAGE